MPINTTGFSYLDMYFLIFYHITLLESHLSDKVSRAGLAFCRPTTK